MKTYTKYAILGIIGVALAAGVTYAATNWSQGINWNIGSATDFTVWSASTGGTQIATGTPLDLSTPTDPTIINYFIQNDGNVPIRVTGTVTGDVNEVTQTWNPSGAYVDVPVGTTRILITLTLTDFSVGSYSVTVTFTSAPVP